MHADRETRVLFVPPEILTYKQLFVTGHSPKPRAPGPVPTALSSFPHCRERHRRMRGIELPRLRLLANKPRILERLLRRAARLPLTVEESHQESARCGGERRPRHAATAAAVWLVERLGSKYAQPGHIVALAARKGSGGRGVHETTSAEQHAPECSGARRPAFFGRRVTYPSYTKGGRR